MSLFWLLVTQFKLLEKVLLPLKKEIISEEGNIFFLYENVAAAFLFWLWKRESGLQRAKGKSRHYLKKQKILRSGKNTQKNSTKKILVTQITMMVWSHT